VAVAEARILKLREAQGKLKRTDGSSLLQKQEGGRWLGIGRKAIVVRACPAEIVSAAAACATRPGGALCTVGKSPVMSVSHLLPCACPAETGAPSPTPLGALQKNDPALDRPNVAPLVAPHSALSDEFLEGRSSRAVKVWLINPRVAPRSTRGRGHSAGLGLLQMCPVAEGRQT
jgi:hypothetical protein